MRLAPKLLIQQHTCIDRAVALKSLSKLIPVHVSSGQENCAARLHLLVALTSHYQAVLPIQAVPVQSRGWQLLQRPRQPGAGAGGGGGAEDQAHPAQRGSAAQLGHQPPPAGLPQL